jgi:hypothetical protein
MVWKVKGWIWTMLLMSTLASADANTGFAYQINTLPAPSQNYMKSYTWHSGCPVPLSDLAELKLTYWGFDHKPHMGILIVNKKVATDVVSIFRELYEQHFAIQRMLPMEAFEGDDAAAMGANNTSAFNCRIMTGKPGIYSLHSYGVAIDINTLLNPSEVRNAVMPAGGKAFLDRSTQLPGKIVHGDEAYKVFIKHGWKWGGDWETPQDYQHFEKASVL